MKAKKLMCLIAALSLASTAYADWEFYEKTNVKGKITGTVKKGRVIEMQSGSIYQVSGITIQVVVKIMPEALVLHDGTEFKVVIDGFDDPLICKQLVPPKLAPGKSSKKTQQPAPTEPKVIQSHIDGDFEGWEGETIFKLDNGQIWQQASYAYTYHYAYHPEIMIINVKGTWKMKVEGVDEMIDVKRLK
jgi:hypothetical protein